jgi:phosphoribosylformylglycinamidine cyclo-ligase
MKSPLSYKDAGVDIDAGDALIEKIKPLAKRTARPGVLAGIGGFGSLFELPSGYEQPVLVSGTDGVGTKLRLAIELNRHDTIGIDLVAMSVNDILVQGAEPLYFLDYFACGALNVDTAASVVSGIATGCELSGCALIGGETAEMPGMYSDGDYDLAGFAVGIVEKSRLIDGSAIRAGDQLIGLASSGPHSNGYSLIRSVIERELGEVSEQSLAMPFGEGSLADALMAPTHLYVNALRQLVKQDLIAGMAHITGGGLLENVPRILPDQLAAHIDGSSWQQPEIFGWLEKAGSIDATEMHRVFNCGIGMVLVVKADLVDTAMSMLSEAGESATRIGEIVSRSSGEPATVIA